MAKEKELKDLFLDTLRHLLRRKEDPFRPAENGEGGAVAQAQGGL